MMAPYEIAVSVATILVVGVAVYTYFLAFLGRGSRPPSTIPSEPLFFAVLVPCLNEVAVIGRTIRSLLSMSGRFHVFVLDDASDDGSQDVVRTFPPEMVTLIQRQGTDSRVGKGAALNNGYGEILSSNVAKLYGDERVIVTVFDSDSNVPPDFIQKVSPYFTDRAVVGVQAEVRMYNARQNRLTYWQNLEFAAWGRLFSRGKDRLGSATLGGNGQCVRLSSLARLGTHPWRPSLTEDLDLSLRLIAAGGRIRFTDSTFVAQEAVAGIRQLIRQRARWVQGHLVAWEHVGPIQRAQIPLRVRLDLTTFLLLPAALAPVALATVQGWRVFLETLGTQSAAALVGWYLFAFACAPLTAWVLLRNGESIPRAVLQAHLFLIYGFFWVIAAGRAAWSILRGDRSWAKTSRAAVPSPPTGGKASPRLGRISLATAVLLAVLLSSTLLMTVTANSAFEAYLNLAAEPSIGTYVSPPSR
jgi:1,2-diacylglycerol 3-beta-glucosyltransferase